MKLITGTMDGSGTTSINYPRGFNWENSYVLSFKILSNTGHRGGISWYTSLGNYTKGDNQAVYVNLKNDNTILIKASHTQYVGVKYSLVLMKLKTR
ncbi:hypothetical protein [Winogradskyella jejuensis]|nr:hypothetical protein [Winogradskyella jejuensis]